MKYILEYSINENKNTLKKAKKDFLTKNLIDINTFNSIVDKDPSRNKKYVYWMIKMKLKDTHQLNHIFDTVYWFDKNQRKIDLDKRDINKLTIEDIEEMQKDPKFMSKKDIKKMQKSSENYKILYEDSKGNKVVEILNRFGCTYWTQLKTDKLEPASFCIGSYNNKKMYDAHMKNLDRKKNGLFFIILPNEEKKYRKIVLTPSITDGIYDITDMDNRTIPTTTEPVIFFKKYTPEEISRIGNHHLQDLNEYNRTSSIYLNVFKKYGFLNKNNIRNFNKFLNILIHINKEDIVKKTIKFYDDLFLKFYNKYQNDFLFLIVGEGYLLTIDDGNMGEQWWPDTFLVDMNIGFKGFKGREYFNIFYVRKNEIFLSEENGHTGKLIIKNMTKDIDLTFNILDKYIKK